MSRLKELLGCQEIGACTACRRYRSCTAQADVIDPPEENPEPKVVEAKATIYIHR